MITTTIGAGVVVGSHSAHAQSVAQATTYSVPAGSLSRALAAFGRQSGLQVTYLAAVASGKTSPGFSGRASRDEAIARILSGSGLSYSFPNSGTVAISAPAAGIAATGDGAVQLDPIEVSGARGKPSDTPFQTPGSGSYISEQDIQRFRGGTTGDMFRSTPGVISGMNHNGAAVDVNIRGLQGMNRVATTVDGSDQSTSSYRGYSGVDNRTYVDPDLISGVNITKGPNGGAAGAIGGTVAMETLKASDILKPGDTYGVRAKVSGSSNGTTPRIGSTKWLDEPSSTFDIENKSGSAAFAVTQTNIDIVAAYVRRISGNYFAGTKGSLYTDNYRNGTKALSNFKYGDEVFNTSQSSNSVLLKTTLRPADGHEVQLAYMRHHNDFGEILPTAAAAGTSSIYTLMQLPLSSILLDQFTARYHWNPSDNNLVDFKTNFWMSTTNEKASIASASGLAIGAKSKSYGVEASNTSRFDIASMPYTLRYGGSIKLEDAESDYRLKTDTQGLPYSIAPDGLRQIRTLFVNGKWEPLPWLAFDAGATYLSYDVQNRATPVYSYRGQPYLPYQGAGVSPNFGITVTPIEGWQLFTTYTGGIRPPSLREGTWNTSGLRFNSNIVAEKARNWEFGTNVLKSDLFLTGDKARLKFAYFRNESDDYIGRRWDDSKPSDAYLTLFNYDKVMMKGFELSGGYDAKKAFADFALNYYTNVQMCRTAETCTNGTGQADYIANQIPPKFSASVTGGLRFFDENLTIGGRYTFMGKRAGTVQEDNYSKTLGILTKAWNPYSLVDVFAQWKINDRFTLDVSAENLLDRYYVDALNNTDMPAPGRTFRVSMTGQLGSSEPLITNPLFKRRSSAVPGADWTGLYVGAHAGQGFAALSGVSTAMDGTTSSKLANESADFDFHNFLMGGQVGFNYQFDNRFVVGIEADYSKTRLGAYREYLSTEEMLPRERSLESKIDHQVDWMATIRGRAGYAFDRWLVYGTGGVAFLKESTLREQYRSNSATQGGTSSSLAFTEFAEKTRTGWTVGAGAEYDVGNGWSMKAEYLYAGFAEDEINFTNARAGVSRTYSTTSGGGFNPTLPGCGPTNIPACFNPTVTTIHPGSFDKTVGRKILSSVDLQLIKIGLNYRF